MIEKFLNWRIIFSLLHFMMAHVVLDEISTELLSIITSEEEIKLSKSMLDTNLFVKFSLEYLFLMEEKGLFTEFLVNEKLQKEKKQREKELLELAKLEASQKESLSAQSDLSKDIGVLDVSRKDSTITKLNSSKDKTNLKKLQSSASKNTKSANILQKSDEEKKGAISSTNINDDATNDKVNTKIFTTERKKGPLNKTLRDKELLAKKKQKEEEAILRKKKAEEEAKILKKKAEEEAKIKKKKMEEESIIKKAEKMLYDQEKSLKKHSDLIQQYIESAETSVKEAFLFLKKTHVEIEILKNQYNLESKKSCSESKNIGEKTKQLLTKKEYEIKKKYDDMKKKLEGIKNQFTPLNNRIANLIAEFEKEKLEYAELKNESDSTKEKIAEIKIKLETFYKNKINVDKMKGTIAKNLDEINEKINEIKENKKAFNDHIIKEIKPKICVENQNIEKLENEDIFEEKSSLNCARNDNRSILKNNMKTTTTPLKRSVTFLDIPINKTKAKIENFQSNNTLHSKSISRQQELNENGKKITILKNSTLQQKQASIKQNTNCQNSFSNSISNNSQVVNNNQRKTCTADDDNTSSNAQNLKTSPSINTTKNHQAIPALKRSRTQFVIKNKNSIDKTYHKKDFNFKNQQDTNDDLPEQFQLVDYMNHNTGELPLDQLGLENLKKLHHFHKYKAQQYESSQHKNPVQPNQPNISPQYFNANGQPGPQLQHDSDRNLFEKTSINLQNYEEAQEVKNQMHGAVSDYSQCNVQNSDFLQFIPVKNVIYAMEILVPVEIICLPVVQPPQIEIMNNWVHFDASEDDRKVFINDLMNNYAGEHIPLHNLKVFVCVYPPAKKYGCGLPHVFIVNCYIEGSDKLPIGAEGQETRGISKYIFAVQTRAGNIELRYVYS